MRIFSIKGMTPRQVLGTALLIVSCLAYGILPLIPFLPLESSEKLAWGGAVFVFAQVTWWVSMPLLGPEVLALSRQWWEKLKAIFIDDGTGKAERGRIE